jgi:transposase-like protein
MVCKGCASHLVVKNGKTRGKQRYKCKSCSLNFVQGDARVRQETAVKRAFAVILYSLGKASYGFMAKLFGVTRPAVYRWIRQEAARLNEPRISPNIQEIEFDDTLVPRSEMWHFVGSKKTSSGSSKPWIAARGELFPGLPAIVMLQPSKDSMKKSDT